MQQVFKYDLEFRKDFFFFEKKKLSKDLKMGQVGQIILFFYYEGENTYQIEQRLI